MATVLIFVGFLKWTIDKLVPTIENFQQGVTHSMDANTEAVTQSHEYLKKRNGSLEKNQENMALQLESVTGLQKELVEKLENMNDNTEIKKQNVEHQHVQKETK